MEILTEKQAAEMLQVPMAKLWDLLNTGQLAGKKLGIRTARILREDIIEYLKTPSPAAAKINFPRKAATISRRGKTELKGSWE